MSAYWPDPRATEIAGNFAHEALTACGSGLMLQMRKEERVDAKVTQYNTKIN